MQSSMQVFVGDMFRNMLRDSNPILDSMSYYWKLIQEVKGTRQLIASPFGAR